MNEKFIHIFSSSGHALVIDNKDYNYTLIISGQNIQVIHHDTNRNLTYRHGLDVRILIEYECWKLDLCI